MVNLSEMSGLLEGIVPKEEKVGRTSVNPMDEEEIEEINEASLIFYPKLVGNPYGCFEDKLNFLKSLLETKNVVNVNSLVKTAISNFGRPITTEFLKNLGGDGRRISELRYRAGFKAVPIKYYFSEMTNTKFKTNMKNYTMKDGKYYLTSDVCSVGRFRKRKGCKSFHKWISNKEFRDMNKELKKVSEKVAKEIEDRDFRTEITLNNLFNQIEGNPWRSVKELDMNENQYRAYSRLRDGHVKSQRIGEMYAWKIEDVKKMFSELVEGTDYQFPVKDFCELFRKDRMEVEKEAVERKLTEIAKKEGVNRKFMIEEGVVKVTTKKEVIIEEEDD